MTLCNNYIYIYIIIIIILLIRNSNNENSRDAVTASALEAKKLDSSLMFFSI